MNLYNITANFVTALEAAGRSERTIHEYQVRLHPLCAAIAGDLTAITAGEIDRYVAGLWRRGLAAATVGGHVQAIKAVFRFAVERGHLARSPAAHLRKVRADRATGRERAIAQGDMDAMIDLARARGLAYELAIMCMLADTGARVGELCGLDLDDVDLMRLEAHARTGKTGARMLDFTYQTAEALHAWLAVRPATDPRALFTTRAGRATGQGIYRRLAALGRELGIRRFNPHAWRHRVGQGWLDRGANLEVVREKLGHRSIETTARFYAHQDRSRIRAATRRFSLLRR